MRALCSHGGKFIRAAQAFRLGLGDGWGQPRELNWTRNVEHLIHDGASEDSALTWQDRGANVGQFARAGIWSESWREGFWPFVWRTPDLRPRPIVCQSCREPSALCDCHAYCPDCCSTSTSAALDYEPRCDVCGTHMEEAPTWCGECGNCREHCNLFAH